jgi:polar amino acid transport system substrate-binding protein
MSQFRYALAGILAAAVATGAAAQQKAGPACPAQPISLGVYEFGNFYHAGNGLDKDVAEQLAARSGCKFELRAMSRAQIWSELQAGSLDMTLSAAATPERTAFAWGAPYLWVKNKVILSKDVDANIHSIADFIAAPNLRAGVARGHFVGRYYDDFVAQLRNIARVEDVGTTEQLYAMFRAGRFQAVLGTQMVHPAYLAGDQVRIEDWDPNGPKVAANLLVSKKKFSRDESKRWAELLKGMSSDGTLLRLIEKYVPPADAIKMLTP